MDKFTMIRMVDSGDEDYPLIWKWYENGNYDKIANYLEEWDYGESHEESDPKLGLYDRTLFKDDTYELIYNISLGGVFALFAKLQ
jgi:hypothetical protein